jgi:hypothetical protein
MMQGRNATGRLQLGLALALLAVLVAFTVLQGEPQAARPFDPASAAPNGLRALWLCLQAMNYQVERNDGVVFTIPQDCAVIFVFPNQHAYTPEEAITLHRWVEAGGTLVLIGIAAFDEALVAQFHVGPGESLTEFLGNVEQQQPLLPDLPTPIRIGGEGAALDLTEAAAVIPMLATAEGEVTLALQQIAAGVVWHATLHHNLTNEQLRDPAQATVVPAFLRHAPTGSRLLIDTYHLFGPDPTAGNQIQSLQDWLYRTPLGWAVLFGLATTLLFWLLQGQRLGPPLPTAEESRQREAAEYVMAMANLLRRSQQRTFVADHHKRRLKRGLGRALNVSAQLDDATFLRLVEQGDSTVMATPEPSLATIFRTLADSKINEEALTQMASQIDLLLERYGRKPVNTL